MPLKLLTRQICRQFHRTTNRRSDKSEPQKGDLATTAHYIKLCNDFDASPVLGAKNNLIRSMTVHDDFLSAADEQSILAEIEPYMARMKYEFDHWDDAIHGYRETERLKWNESNTAILNRVRDIAFPQGIAQIKHVHVLDLDRNGYIKPHVDAVRFCGDTIAGLSLLSDSVMRLVHVNMKHLYADVMLRRRSLYVMRNAARFEYTHEILPNDLSRFRGEIVAKGRRISVICRNEPQPTNSNK